MRPEIPDASSAVVIYAKSFGSDCAFQGIIIGTGENSEFGEIFKMMQAEEVKIDSESVCGLYFSSDMKDYIGYSFLICRSRVASQPLTSPIETSKLVVTKHFTASPFSHN